MIGVVLALQYSFGESVDIERRAFEFVIGEYVAAAGRTIDAPIAQRLAALDESALRSPAGLTEMFSEVLGLNLLSSAAALRWEARFRMVAARFAADRFVAFDDVRRGLEKLRELNVPRVALSGGWPSIDQRKADSAGFDGPIIFAQDIENGDAEVCSERTFEQVTRTLLLPRELLWFVSSAAETEIVPAKALGLHTVWVNRTGAAFPNGLPAPDVTISTFDELVEVLREPYTRGLLELRHILRTVLEWRPGHFVEADDSSLGDDRTERVDLT